MAHFAIICPLLTGHINPMAAIASELRARGHRTTLFSIADGAPIAQRLDLAFEPVGADTHPVGSHDETVRLFGVVKGLRGYAALRQTAIEMLTMLARELPAKLVSMGVDMIVCDQAEIAGALIAYRVGLPFVSVASGLPLNWEPDLPPMAFGWSYGSTRWHRWRNIAGAYGFNIYLRPLMQAAQTIAQGWRLKLGSDIHDYMSGLAQVSQMAPSLDMPRRALSGCFHYCGPFRQPMVPPVAQVAPRDPDRVFASLGSMQGHRVEIFEAIARATAANGLSLTVAHGGRLSPAGRERLAARADVQDFVDQTEIMGQVGLAVLHGGLNTVLDALAGGVPMVVLPVGFEQKAIAARVQRSGVGRVCSLRRAQTGRIADLVAEVRHNPAYAAAAAKMRDEIKILGGAKTAADIIETVLRTGTPVFSAEARGARALRLSQSQTSHDDAKGLVRRP